MPVNVVRMPEEEIAWERAKAGAREQYPEATVRTLLSDRDGYLQEDGLTTSHIRLLRPIEQLLREELDD